MIGTKNTNGVSATTPITTIIDAVACSELLLIVSADNDDIVAANRKTLAVPAHTRSSGRCNTLDEAIGVVLEPALMSFPRRHVPGSNGHQSTYGYRRVGADVDALRHGRAVVVKHEVARRGERCKRQRRRHGAGYQQDGSGSFDHPTGPSRFRAWAVALWSRLKPRRHSTPKKNHRETTR